MAYQDLKDPHVIGASAGEHSFASARIFAKFCTFGIVTSKKWIDSFVVIQDSFVRLYDSEETYKSNPANYALEIFLAPHYTCSATKSKDYSHNSYTPAIIHYMYLQISNGMWAPTKKLKIGAGDIATLDRLRRVVKTATSF